ncbi:MAG: cytochrome c [bacterium]|nr:cytochrome c [bacterium]
MKRPTTPVAARASRRAGSAAHALLFWLIGIFVMVVPFFRDPDTEVLFGQDGTRAETDIPFAEDVALVEEELGLEFAEPLAEASEHWFGLDSSEFRQSGLVDHARIASGRRLYEANCQGCHGADGDGGGAAARFLSPRPRNFRKGVFKFTSTATFEKPLRSDLLRVITTGLAGSAMPSFFLIPEEHRLDLVEYVRYMSMRGEFETLMLDVTYDEEEFADATEMAEIVRERWLPSELRALLPTTPETPDDDASVARGRELFLEDALTSCAKCHGATGKGDGPSATGFEDDWGYDIVPRDFTGGVFRAGESAEDLWRSIATGINGTPMGQFSGSIGSDQIWDLVHFVQSLTVEAK